MNQRNFGIVEGRLAKDPVVFDNSDGSKKVLLTVMARRNFKNAEGQTDSDAISLSGFIPADKTDLSVYGLMHKGDMIGVQYAVRQNVYEKDGEKHYEQILAIENIDLKESKAAVEARANQTQAAPESI